MTKICTDDLTVGQVRELAALVGLGNGTASEHPYKVGKAYFIRTVTNYYTGRLIKVTAQELVLEDAAWIADTGRFSAALESGDFSEVEPYPAQEVIIGRSAIIDATLWDKTLPRKTK